MSRHVVASAENENYRLEILPDDSGESPRQWDNLGTMVCWHSRYNLGDEHGYGEPADFEAEWNPSNAIILPLFLYDHSGLSMSTGSFRDPWDSGQVGYVYVPLAKVRAEWNVKRISKRTREKAIACLQAEVSTYDDFLRGNVYGFDLQRLEWDPASDAPVVSESVDSCFGFYGTDWKNNGLAEHLPDGARDLVNAL